MKDNDLLSVAEFAKALGKSPQSVIAMIKQGEVAAEDHRTPGSSRPIYRIERRWIRLWRQSRRVGVSSRPLVKIETPSGVREVDAVIS